VEDFLRRAGELIEALRQLVLAALQLMELARQVLVGREPTGAAQ